MEQTAHGWLVFGLDASGKPHGSRFKEEEGAIAAKAAEAMRYHLLKVTTPEATVLAERLPPGRPYATGKAFAPLIKQELYDELVRMPGAKPPPARDPVTSGAGAPNVDAPPQDQSGRQATPPGEAAPDPWAAIKAGSEVLSTAPGEDAWWPCEVVGVSDKGGMLTLRWSQKEFAGLPPFMMPRGKVALLRPASAA